MERWINKWMEVDRWHGNERTILMNSNTVRAAPNPNLYIGVAIWRVLMLKPPFIQKQLLNRVKPGQRVGSDMKKCSKSVIRKCRFTQEKLHWISTELHLSRPAAQFCSRVGSTMSAHGRRQIIL